jgi:hypothetical protein
MKRNLLLLCLLFSAILMAQDNKESDFKFNLKGFVKADYIYDSRQSVEAREGFFIMYPKPIVEDANGIDINDKAMANQYAMTTRLGLEITGPEIFNAKSSGLIESDFTGPSNMHNNVFRLRHAYLKLDWEKTSFLMGQYWHPMVVPEMMPNILSLNTGSPMHSFCRGPQIRISQMTGSIKWVAVAYSQRDYVSTGPQGPSNIYLRNAVLPDLTLQLQWNLRNLFAGLGANYKELHFRSYTDDQQLLSHQVGGWSYIGFAKIENKSLDLRIQAVYGENMFDHLMIGNTAVSMVDSVNALIEYSNFKAASAWISAFYKNNGWRIGTFGGYIQNLGAEDEIVGPVYGRGQDIRYVYRISPQWSYQRKNLIISNEWEYTVAAYGTPDEFGKVLDTYEVGNLRFTFSLIYMFKLK